MPTPFARHPPVPAPRTVLVLACLLGCLSLPARPQANLLINEAVISNGGILADENGDSPDWIELFNPGPGPVQLAGWSLSDDSALPDKWRFTGGSVPPGGFQVVFASGKNRQPGLIAATSPTNIPGLQLWLRADAVNPADPVQVRVDRGIRYLRQWRNLAGSTGHATMDTSMAQPLWVTNSTGFAGRAALRFDGNDDHLLLPAAPGRNHFTVIVVARASLAHELDPAEPVGFGGTAGQRYLFGAYHGGDFQAGAGLSLGTNGAAVYEHGSAYMPALATATLPLTGPVVISLTYSNRRPSLAVQGAVVSVGFTSARTNVNAPFEIGTGAYGAFAGDLAEVLFYNRALTEAERAAIEAQVAARHGITLAGFVHTNFKLDGAGERFQLGRPDGTIADRWEPVAVPRNTSRGRRPDGAPEFAYFETPTPGASNLTTAAGELLGRVEFSVERGSFTNAFLLALGVTNDGARIHYTLDGSEPTTNSARYTGPILVSSRAGEPNRISTIPTAGGWQPPAGEVFKLTVVRARAFKSGAIPGGIRTHSYLVAPGPRRYTLPVVSLAADSRGFFDASTGIYVPGNAAGGNYFQRGDAWTRNCSFEFFEPDGQARSVHDCGVKIHGNTSRGFPVKALDLIADWQNEGDFRHRFFPERTRDTWNHLLLRQSGHDYFLTYFRDLLMTGLAVDFGMEGMAGRPVVVFLNGEYWGIHNLREKEDEEFLADHGGPGVDPAAVDFLEGYAAPIAGDTAHYNAMLDLLGTRDMTQATNYATVQAFMDVTNYMDYKAAEIWTYRWDIGNHRLWRPRTPAGRWRWLQFDNDVGWGGFWAVQPAWEFDFLAYDTEPNGPWTQYQASPGGHDHNSPVTTFLLRKLLENPVFKRDFLNRFADLMNTAYHPAAVTPRIDQLAARIAPEMNEHIRRWRQPASLVEWTNNVDLLRRFATNRSHFCRQHVTNKFGLRGFTTVTLRVNTTNGGSVRLNSLTLAPPTNAPFVGTYFRDIPVSVVAVASPGWKFTNWTGTLSLLTNLLVNVSSNLTLTANFVPLPATNPPSPPPWDLARGSFTFNTWPASAAAGTPPSNMVFLQWTNGPDPGPGWESTNHWRQPYDRTNRSRINGLGADGVAFLNTSDPQTNGGGWVGAAVVGLRTIGRSNLWLTWRGGTLARNPRQYAIRLQARVGVSNVFTDLLDATGQPVEYRSETPGRTRLFPPLALPASLAGQPYIQLRWKYHWVSGGSGARDQLRLDDLTVYDTDGLAAPRFTGPPLAAGDRFELRWTGSPGRTYSIEASTNLVSWSWLATVTTDPDGGGRFTPPVPGINPDGPAQFFRVRAP